MPRFFNLTEEDKANDAAGRCCHCGEPGDPNHSHFGRPICTKDAAVLKARGLNTRKEKTLVKT
jgi:hypothetical protein